MNMPSADRGFEGAIPLIWHGDAECKGHRFETTMGVHLTTGWACGTLPAESKTLRNEFIKQWLMSVRVLAGSYGLFWFKPF